jgi:hypothetical protein
MTITLLVGPILAVIFFALLLDSLCESRPHCEQGEATDTRSPVRGAERLTRAIRAA